MDLRQIRADLGAVAASTGFTSWDYVPDDPKNYPCAVVGGLLELEKATLRTYRIKLQVTFYVSAADPEDAAARLDAVLSSGIEGGSSFFDALDSVHTEDGPAWRSCRFDGAGPYQKYSLPAGGVALGCTVVLELTA